MRGRLGQSPMHWGPLLFFAVGILCAWPASAAQVTVVPDQKSSKGAVMLSRGQGYAPITGPTTANTGDKVVAFTGGHARVTYPDGCTVEVNDGGDGFCGVGDFTLQGACCVADDERKSSRR